VEDSPLLRGLVQGVVSVGILSVLVAATGVTQISWLNLLAIPLSALGAYYSWRRRQRSNAVIKGLIALGMVLALGWFFSRLLPQPGDTRILLAELLLQLQVLHSFDLPRRKDLGYSMMIGLILLGVAATVSQTLAFAPLLLLFLLLALPVLALDYHSRLGLAPRAWRSQPPRLALGQLLTLFSLIVCLGLVIFLCLPRLPGYQIQNFPVSATLDTPAGFTGHTIINPAYGQGEQDGSGESFSADNQGSIQGQGNLEGPGQVDSTTYYGFNPQMNQNLRGVMTPQVVMRVRSQAPGFWRVMAFDRYTGQGWTLGSPDQVQTLQRSGFSYQTLLPLEPSLAVSRPVVQTYTLVNNFPNLVPALSQPRDLYFPTREVALDSQGGLRSPVALEAGITYTVVSQVPQRDRSQLRQARRTYSQAVQRQYLQVPERIRPAVQRQTKALLARSPKPLADPYEQALFLAQALKQSYTLQPDLPFFDADQDLVETFLFTTGGGYPDHFATVLTVMLRSIGIPARLAVGFGEGQFNPFTGYYVVRNTDAHALTEVYFPQYGWFGFDPIPGHELLPPSAQPGASFSTLRRLWHWLAGWLPSPLTSGLQGLAQTLMELVRRIWSGLGGGWLAGLGSLALAMGAGLAIGAIHRGLRQAHRWWRLSQLPPAERVYQQMLTWCQHQGLAKQTRETPLEHSQRIAPQLEADQAGAVEALVWAYLGWHYGGESQDLRDLTPKLAILSQSTGKLARRPVAVQGRP
jgi:transglutaminase-like putative cysteine protease